MKIGAIIQARMSSTRLPGKIARQLPYGSGMTVLEQVIRRVKRCRRVDNVIVATTTGKDDDVVVRLAKRAGVKTFRGSKEDVLSRYYLAAKNAGLDAVVRVTSDCPCIDPTLIDKVIRLFLFTGADYASNVLKSPYPDGMDVEVFKFSALETVHLSSKDIKAREHVTFGIYSFPDKFKVRSLPAPKSLSGERLRITLDTPEDYSLLCAIYALLYQRNNFFGLNEITRLLHSQPWLKIINGRIVAKKVFSDLRAEVGEAVKVLRLQDLDKAADFLASAIKK